MGKRAYVHNGKVWESIIGLPGEPGKSIQLKGQVLSPAALPAAGANGDAYMIGYATPPAANDPMVGHVYVWEEATQSWVDGGLLQGPKGEPGETLHPKGVVADIAGLPATPANMDVYVTQDKVEMFVYNPSSPVAIPPGNPGAGYVNMGRVQGPPGANAHLQNKFPSHTNLPATGSPGAYAMTDDDGHLWGWDEAAKRWVDGGQIRADNPDMKEWQAKAYLPGDMVRHSGAMYVAAGTAIPGDEPGSVTPLPDVVSHWDAGQSPTGSITVQGSTQVGLPLVETFNWRQEAVARPVGDTLSIEMDWTFGINTPYTIPAGPFAGRDLVGDSATFINTGNPALGTDGWYLVNQEEVDAQGGWDWTDHQHSVWRLIGLPDGQADGDLLVWSAPTTTWVPKQASSFPLGGIIQSLLTEAAFVAANGAGWRLCDGQSIAGTPLAAASGNGNAPDLRGMFLRGAGANGNGWDGGVLGQQYDWETRLPATLVMGGAGGHSHGDTASAGTHNHGGRTPGDTGPHRHWYTSPLVGSQSLPPSSPATTRAYPRADGAQTWTDGSNSPDAGAHAHPIQDGGDHHHTTTPVSDHTHTVSGNTAAETVPRHTSINFFIFVGA